MAEMERPTTTGTTTSLRTEPALSRSTPDDELNQKLNQIPELASQDENPPLSDVERLHNLEQAVAAGQYERRQLLKQLVARDDELTRLKERLSALTSEPGTSTSQLTQNDDVQPARERPNPTRHGLATYLVAVGGIAAISIGLFHAGVGRPMQARLEREVAALHEQMTLESQTIGDRQAAVQKESDRLAQLERDLNLERQDLVELKAALDAERAALEKSRAAPRQTGTAVASGVLVWRGELTAPATVIITGNKASFGTVSGALPGKPVTLRIVPFYGRVTILEDIGPANGWGRFHFQIDGQGPVTVFLLWV